MNKRARFLLKRAGFEFDIWLSSHSERSMLLMAQHIRDAINEMSQREREFYRDGFISILEGVHQEAIEGLERRA